MATISDVRQRIVDILNEFKLTLPDPYATKATVHRYVPRGFNAAELPAFVVMPSEATHRRPQMDTEESSRIYTIRMYIAPLSQGVENQLEEYAETWVDDVRLFLNKRPRLEDSTGNALGDTYSAIAEGDAGMVAGTYPPNLDGSPAFLLIEWRLRVVTRKQGIT